MNSNNYYGLKIAGVLMFVACACVPQGRAQRSSAFDGKFSLSEPVIWQGKMLPAGDYTFSVTRWQNDHGRLRGQTALQTSTAR